jgi:sterol desaturase/sphingolipid hydroxylase (fatty acid hydroxylase superfamily)
MTPLEQALLYVATPTVFVCALVEALVLARRSPYNWRAFGMSTFDLFARVGFGLVVRWSIATPLLIWAIRHRLNVIALDNVTAVAVLFVGQEFCYYWYHRAAHRVRWFWCVHSVHHSPNELNLSAAFRIGIFGKLTGVSLFFAPLVWLGFDVRTVFSVLTLNLLYQFWIHATWIPRLGWLEGIFNTPSAHRVHHAANVQYLDANYGGVLLVFDRLFGTYRPERDDLPCRYGLVQPLASNNPLVVEGGPWWALLRDLGRALRGPTPGGRLRAVLGHVFMPPGWAPDGPGQTTEALRARAAGGASQAGVSAKVLAQ